ncbi:unnamed protein product [Leptidea sinapis]|uniref:PH domain-containing protein n=1 Tax=Leptidea sinapis TaxID=189913 RepID=A0A5E4Q1C0_9NEOP|nr:unnamed protein product [Leptidea sinapis]
MWTLFCVHNGKTPYLEQYPQQESSLTHRPTWRACLKTARHVTASVKPHSGQEYDFLIDTDNGPVRMLAPDWESMQDWVATLRNKLHELRILTRGENVYGAGPVVATPRAPARDPTSPLPPTPPVPPDSPPQSNVTVIKVSNKPAPHTAIPVLGPPSDVFDFNFKQNLTINQTKPDIVNIINTNDRYGTVFDPEPQYGHISLTTTVSLTGEHKMADATANDSVYERLCMASTSNASPLSIRRLRNGDKNRKSSLPNLETDYECLFPSSSENNLVNGVNTTEVSTLERRTNVERSQSQNAYDVAPRARENIARRSVFTAESGKKSKNREQSRQQQKKE